MIYPNLYLDDCQKPLAQDPRQTGDLLSRDICMSMSQKNQTLSKSLSLSFLIGSGSLLAFATSTSGNITCVVLQAKNLKVSLNSFPSLPAPTCCQSLVLHTQKTDPNQSLLFTFASQPLFFPLSHSCIVISDSVPQTYPTMTFLHLTAKRVLDDPMPTIVPGLFPEHPPLLSSCQVPYIPTIWSYLQADLVP